MQSPRIHNRAPAKLKSAICLFLLVAAVLADTETKWAWMVEPSFMDYKVRKKVEGSERTILALVRIRDGEIFGLEDGHERTLDLAMKTIQAEASRTLADLFATLKPDFIRDKNGVIQYASLESPNPLTASCVLAPGFAEKFADTLGPDLLVAMPNRNQILVFSRQDQAFERMAEFIIAGYLGSNYPVSREIFALENGKLRSLGVLQ
ncbi:MAG: hypothetical protein IAE94_12690 [Chthoniobacterales bacterium]|nr:hypothetical protein [Chthoniobacterales bacterium]